MIAVTEKVSPNRAPVRKKVSTETYAYHNQNILIANREENFMDNLPGSMFQEIVNWRYQFILPVEDVDFLPGTDRS